MTIQGRTSKGLAILVMMTLGACGGSSNSPANDPPPPTGGITGTGSAIIKGSVSGFGSVIVNGTRYDTSAATFTIDGQVGTQSDLAVGDVVVLRGTVADDSTGATASTVEFDDNVEGPVTSVDEASSSFVVLEQLVFVDDGTSVDDNCPSALDVNDPSTLGVLLTVAAVEVSGSVMTDGSVMATRIECKSILGEMEVTGTVTAVPTASTFEINSLTVDFSGVMMLEDFPGGRSVETGDLVEAKGTSLGPNRELVATMLEYKGARLDGVEGDHVEIEGFIDAGFVDATSFSVSGTPVVTDQDTVYEGGVEADLGPNLKVEVEGLYDANGVLNATKVEIKLAKVVRITALVDSTAAGANPPSLVMLGVTIEVDADITRFEDKTGVEESFNIGLLAMDDYVEIRGQEIPAGSGIVFAAILERDDAKPETILRGFVESEAPLSILGVTINTNGGTEFQDANGNVLADEAAFLNLVSVGSLIKVKGTEDLGLDSITAEEIEIKIE